MIQIFFQGPTDEPTANQQTAQQTAPPPAAEAPPPSNAAAPPSNAPPSGMPMMFNPSQFGAPQAAPSGGSRMKYGQRRAYPK